MNSKRVRQGKRGQSEVLGVVLLLGLVLAGALVVVMMGSSTVSDIQQQQSDQGAAVVVQEIDSRLQSLSGVGDTKSKEFVVDEALPRELKLKENTGYLNITVNDRAACSVNVSLDTIQQTNSDGQVIGLQAGGVWRKTSGDSGSSMIAGPDVTFENGTLDISLVNMSGNIDKGTNTAVRNVTASRNRTRTISETLFSGPCSNLDNATIEVQSQFSDAWANYLSQETGVSDSNVATSGNTVELFIPEKRFPQRVDNERNQVVNFSSAASYMDSVSIDNGTIEIDKNAGNDYRVFVSALDSWQPNIGGIRNFSGNVSGVERKPIDFVIVLDKSGSMGTGPSSKRQEAREAAKEFVGITEFKKGDRIGLVGYDRWPNYVKPNGRLFSSDPAALNNSISNNFDLHPSCTNSNDNQCNTDFADALQHANALLDLRSNTNERDKHILLLTDGRARPADKCENYWEKEIQPGVDNLFQWGASCYYFSNYTRPVNKYAVRYANNSAKSNITIHTVAFGSNANPAVLKRIKNQTEGGTYDKAAVGDLEKVFRSIANNITSNREVIALDPLSTNVSTGSGVVTPPQVPGDTSGLATMTAGTKRFVNVNDPTAPSRFSHALPVSGGVEFNISAYSATCSQWQGTTQVKTNSTTGTQYPVVRCANMSSPQRMQPDNVTVITDEANISSKALNSNSAWWQPNMSDMLNDSRIYNSTTGDYELESNEALALLEFNNTGSADPAQVIPVVFRVGISEDSVSSTDIINVEVSEVTIEG